MKLPALDGWVPSRVLWREAEPSIEWIWMGKRRFLEPFFSDTLRCAFQNPVALLFRHETPIEALEEWRRARPGLRPAGLIFHMSRCGSTLISQLLASLPEAIVISEAPPLDSLLRGGPCIEDERRSLWVQGLISALGQPRSGNETRYFIKLDCWHVFYLEMLQRALPDVPWIFLYRDPVEVLASHERIPALWSVRGMLDPECIGGGIADVIQMDRLEYCARVLEKVCECALSLQRGNSAGKLVNYTELPGAVWASVASHFGVTFSPSEIADMQRQSSFHAKTPGLYFERDGDRKRASASAAVAGLADRWLYPIYQRLERARAQELR